MFELKSTIIHKFQPLIVLLVLAAILSIGLIPGPKLLGVWESYYFYHTFGPLNAPLEFQISPRANIGDPGHGLIELSRYLIDWFGLNLNLETFRIPAIFYGALSIIFFFIIARRYFGTWSAMAATALLAVNPMFHQQQHTMTVLIISGMSFLFFVERLQALELRYGSMATWLTFSIAAALVALHYGVGRIYALILFIFWFIKAFTIVYLKPGGSNVFRIISHKLFIALLICAGLLILMDYRNLISLLRVNSLFLPSTGEIAVLSGLYSNVSADFFTTLHHNIKVLMESLFTYGGNYHSVYSTYRIADYRFPLIVPAVLPFVLCGLIISFVHLRKRTVLLAMPYLSVIVLFLVCTIPLLFSSVFVNYPELPNALMGTLSNHRLYYLLFPLYLFIAVFFNWAYAYPKKKSFIVVPLTVAIISIFVWSIYGLAKENSRFQMQLADINPSLSGFPAYKQWDDGAVNIDRSDLHASHFQQHAQYHRAAQEITQLVRKSNIINQPLLIQVDINRFTESPLKPYTLPYIKEVNYHAPYLALYLNDSGIYTAWALMLNGRRTTKQMGFSRPREYSAAMALYEDTRLRYKDPQELIGAIQYFGPGKPLAILATTPEETVVAKRWFDEHNIVYQIVTLLSLKE